MPQDQSSARIIQNLQQSGSPTVQQFMQPSADPTSIDQGAGSSPVAQQSVPQSDEQPPRGHVSDQQKLALFENVLQEVESQQADTPSQPQGGGLAKETFEQPQAVAPQELPGGMQYAEVEHSAEISPEVEAFLQNVEEQHQHMPQEIVAAAEAFHQSQAQTQPSQSVKVLPITKKTAEEAKKKNPSHAVRWLLEFSNKMSQLFAGKSIYRTD